MNSRIYTDEFITDMRSHLIDEGKKAVTYPKFIFLCGKAYSEETYKRSNRGTIQRYMESKDSDIFIVLSEHLWEDAFSAHIDLLTFEEFLAEVSDFIFILAESAGSLCELGAFTYEDKSFTNKLIIVLDEKYKEEKSFIVTGPVAKAERNGANVIYAPLYSGSILSSDELRHLIDEEIECLNLKNLSKNKRIINRIAEDHLDANINIGSFIIELLELIKLLQPIKKKDLIEIYKRVKNFQSYRFVKEDGSEFNKEIKTEYIFKLLEDVHIIDISNDMVACQSQEKIQPLMLRYNNKDENRVRNRILCRKYRYKGF